MKKSIVFKWFVMTVLLFSTMFLFIGVTQNYFFEKYYINKKADSLKAYMQEYVSLSEKEEQKQPPLNYIRIIVSGLLSWMDMDVLAMWRITILK